MAKDEKYYCPRCNSDKIIDFGEIIECAICKKEFFKSDLIHIKEESAILSINEMKNIIKNFRI